MGVEIKDGSEDKKVILNMEIFATGWHVPAIGDPREWTATDLEGLVATWKQGVADPVHLKIGHTSDEFSALVASKLGVPVETVKGEGPAGDGVISLGVMTDLRYRAADGVLESDWEVPAAVADLIETGYSDVSSEMLIDYDGHAFVLSAVALLGAERPAVKGLEGLEDVAVLVERQPALVARFKSEHGRLQRPDPVAELDELEEVNAAMQAVIKGKKSALALGRVWGQMRSKWEALIRSGSSYEEDSEVDIKELVAKLKLQEGADEAAVMARLDELLSLVAGIAEAIGLGAPPEGEDEGMPDLSGLTEKVKTALQQSKEGSEDGGAGKSEESAAFKEQGQKLTHAEARIAVLEKDKRVAAFREVTTKFTAIEGTPAALAEELVTIEDKMGRPAADKQVERWQHTQALAVETGITERIGTSRLGDGAHPVEAEIIKWADENGKTMGEAYAHFKEERPAEWAEYRKATSPSNGDGAE